jgi:SAM-dependent methyltransferase
MNGRDGMDQGRTGTLTEKAGAADRFVGAEILRCPACGGALDAEGNALACAGCAKAYPVVRGVPRFVDSDAYVGNFSLEWKIHKKTQVDDAKTRTSEANFHLRFGLPRNWWKGKRVLDVGVGVGRYAQVPLDAGAEVWGADLSYAVDTARVNLDGYPAARLVQADVFALPFAPESFDAIYSFGVLHHTPDPRKAFEGLLRYLKPGGVICLTLYTDYGMYHSSRYLRKVTTKLPASVLYPISALATLLLYVPYRYLGFRYGLLGRFMPISLSGNIREAILDTFDCYSPKYQFTYADDEVFAWFKQAGLRDIEVRPQPVTMLGYKA